MRNNKGIALIVAVVLSAVSLIFIGTLMSLVITGTKMSGYIKSYTTALEAAKGGAEYFTYQMKDYIYVKGGISGDETLNNSAVCKINQDISNWNVSCKDYMKDRGYTLSELSSFSSINDITKYYDTKYTYGNYNVYIKLVDTKGTGKWYYYTVQVISQNKNNPKEIAWLTIFFRTD